MKRENPALTDEILKKTRLEFKHYCDNFMVDTAFGEVHRRTLSNIVIVTDFIIMVIFLLNGVYMDRQINNLA